MTLRAFLITLFIFFPHRTFASGYRIVGMATAGDKAYLVCSDSLLRVVDLSDPTSPVGIGALRFADADRPDLSSPEISLYGDYAYVTGNVLTNGFKIVDLSNPVRPRRVGMSELPAITAVYGSRGYAIEHRPLNWDEDGSPFAILILDLSDPLHPTQLGRYDMPIRAAGEGSGWPIVTVSQNMLAVLNLRWNFEGTRQTNVVQFVDCTDPAKPTLAGSITRNANADPFWGLSEAAAAKLSDGLFSWVVTTSASSGGGRRYSVETYDVTDFSSPKKLGVYSSTFLALNVFATFDRNFVHIVSSPFFGNGRPVYDLIDISNPTSAAKVGSPTLSYHAATHPQISQNLALFSCFGFLQVDAGRAGLDLFEFSSSSPPRKTNHVETSDPSDPLAPPLQLEMTVQGQAGVWVNGPIGAAAVIERSPDLRNWNQWKTVNVGDFVTEAKDSLSKSEFFRGFLVQ